MARLRYLQNARTGTAGTISKDTKPIQFYDDDMYIYASADGVLEIVSDTTLTLTAPTINIASSTVSAFTYPITIDFDCTASSVSDLTITSSSSSTSGSVVIKPLYVDATMSATGGLGRAIEGRLTVSGKLGDYGNAIKGYTDLTDGTGCAGLVSAICAEMKMPASTALGTHAVLEIELVMPTSAVIQQGIGANCTSFIRARVSDNSTAVASFNEYGYLLDLQGLTSGSTDLFDGCTLKCAIGSTKMYLLMSTATASFTTAYPIVFTGTVTDGITFGGTITDEAIQIGGTYDHGIRFTEDPVAGDVTNSFINVGDYTTGIAVAPTTANMFGVMHNVTVAVNVGYWYQAYYTKITTSGTTTDTSIAGHALRMQVGSSLGAVYGIQCHTNITATNTCAQEIASISTMVDLAAGTTTTTDRVVALQALVTGSGTAGTVTGLLHVAYFGNRGTQIDTDAIVFINNQSAAVSDVAIEFDLDGTVTNVFEFNGTVCDAFDHNDRTSEYGAFDQCILIPVKVAGESAQLYIMAAETWADTA